MTIELILHCRSLVGVLGFAPAAGLTPLGSCAQLRIGPDAAQGWQGSPVGEVWVAAGQSQH